MEAKKKSVKIKTRLVCIDNVSDFKIAESSIIDNDIILSFDLDVQYLCNNNNFSCVDIKEILRENINSGEEYIKLTSFVSESVELIKSDCSVFFNNSKDLKIYDWFFYPIKITIDQLLIYKRTIEKIFNIYSVNEIFVSSEASFKYTDQLMIDPQTRLLSLVAQDVARDYKHVKICYYDSPVSNEYPIFFPFGGVDSSAKFPLRKPKMFIKNGVNFFTTVYSIIIDLLSNKKKRFITVGCREINSISSELKLQSSLILWDFNFSLMFKKNKPINLGKVFLKSEFIYDGFDFKKYLELIARVIAVNTKRILFREMVMRFVFKQMTPNCVFVQTLSSFNIYAMIAKSISEEFGIKVVCWMHGGYGGYTSLPGYDITDFRHTSNHILYGNAANDTITSSKGILHTMYPGKKFNTLILGSPYIEKLYKNIKKYQSKKEVRIVFSFPGFYSKNSYYYGYDRPYDYMNFWHECKAIILFLLKFSTKFNIVIKDYPSGPFKGLTSNLLEEMHDVNISYISNSSSYKEVIQDADILIYPWVSTSLIEGLHTNADILLYDNSKMTNDTKQVLNNLPIFSTEMNLFLQNLEKYLSLYPNQGIEFSSNIELVKRHYVTQINDSKRVEMILNFCGNNIKR